MSEKAPMPEKARSGLRGLVFIGLVLGAAAGFFTRNGKVEVGGKTFSVKQMEEMLSADKFDTFVDGKIAKGRKKTEKPAQKPDGAWKGQTVTRPWPKRPTEPDSKPLAKEYDA